MTLTEQVLTIANFQIHTAQSIAAEWMRFEKDCFATPYQTFAWTKAWADTLGKAEGSSLCVARLIDQDNNTAALLPIVMSKSAMGTKAQFAGGKHANFNMMLFSPYAMQNLTGPALRQALEQVAKACGIDCFHFIHQPCQWMGHDNPFLTLPWEPSANTAYRADLLADGDEMIRSLMSSESRKKLRNKEKRISELGPVRFVKAETPDEIERIITIFLEQKAARFKTQGLDNPFSTPEAREFLRQGAFPGHSLKPSMSLFYLAAGDRIVSILGGAEYAGRMSGMFTSFDNAPEIARYSPGDLLLLHLVQYLSNNRFLIFDLGTGEASYKGDYCKIEEPLFDSILPMTARGQIMANVLRSGARAKRWIKNNPTVLKLIRRLR